MILDTYVSFLDNIFIQLEKKGVDVSKLELDHLAYRTESSEVFDKLKPQFLEIGTLVHQKYISGNLVYVFKLNKALEYRHYRISAVEFIGPNETKKYITGFEHAEFVIKEKFEEFVKRYPLLNWDKSATERSEFPLLKLPLENNIQVKFHYETILELAKFYNEK